MVKVNRKAILLALVFAAFCGAINASPVSAKNSESCISNAQWKFKVNTDISPQVYRFINDVSSDSYGVNWACNTSGSAGVTWITGGSGQSSNGDGSYTIYVNTKIDRTGTSTVGVTGAISGNTNGEVYGTNVQICAQKGSYCWEDIGIEPSTGWSEGSSWGRYYLRATENVNDNEWTDPHTSFIKINADTLLNKKDGSGNKVLYIDEKDDYGLAKLWIYRAFNGINPGWSYFYLVMDKADKVAKFTATSSVVSGDVGSDGRYTVKIKHNIERYDGDSFDTDNKWKTSPRDTYIGAHPSMEGNFKSTKVGDKSGDIIETITGYINYNSTIDVCSKIKYYSEIHTNGDNKQKTTSEVCKRLSRGNPTVTGGIDIEVYGDGYNNKIGTTAKRYVLPSSGNGEYRILFKDKASRNDSIGDGISFDWSTYNTYKSLTSEPGEDKNKSGSTGFVSSGGTIVDYQPEVKGVLKFGQTVTFCNGFKWQSKQHRYSKYEVTRTDANGTKHWGWVTHTDNYTGLSGNKYAGCVEIYREEKPCAINTGKTYGIENGENGGAVGIKNASAGVLSDYIWSPYNGSAGASSTRYTTEKTDAKGLANTWLKPGDQIQFGDQACAGAFYSIETGYATGGTHYSTEGRLIMNSGQVPYGYYGSGGAMTSYYNKKNSEADGYLFANGDSSHPRFTTTTYGYKNPTNTVGANLNAITAATGKPYATWTTGSSGTNLESSGFLSHNSFYPIVEISGSVDTSVSVKTKYSPKATADYGGADGYYVTCKNAEGTGCLFGRQEVGGVIYHTLTWNGVIVSGGVTNNGNPHSATAVAKIPYNYALKPYITNEGNGVIYLGGSKKMYPGVAIQQRKNAWVRGSGATYATVTKNTHISIRVYNQRTGVNIINPVTWYNRLNKNGDESNHTDTSFVNEMFGTGDGVEIPVYADGSHKVGDKICTELTIWPLDSHETGDNRTVYGSFTRSNATDNAPEWALREDYQLRSSGGAAAHSAKVTSCSTVAKRPTMSVESSNAYSATQFNTLYYPKRVSAGDSTKYMFGSWSEYGVFGTVATKNTTFVSGAALGYDTNAHVPGQNSARANSSTMSVAKNAQICTFMTQTFVNSVDNKCQSTDTTIGHSSMNSFLDNIKDRYGGENYGKNYSGDCSSGCRLNNTINPEDYRLEEGNSNSAVVIRVKNSKPTHLSSIPNIVATEDNANPNRTIVYNIQGDLIIDGDINDERGKSVNNLSQITGVVIIAKNVWISSNVTYVNATIVANGQFNSCKYDGGVKITFGDGGTLNSERCNLALVMDAPVFAKQVVLNRTDGAGNTTDSIRRAEIFNLNMADYLWSFQQMTNYSQAITTYSRELPPRY